MGAKLWTTQKSGFCKSLVGLSFAAVGVLALISAQPAFADVDPPGCMTNGLDLDITPSATLVVHGDVITYIVCFDNIGAGNCNDTDVDSSLVLPDGSSILLLDGAAIHAGEMFCCPGADPRCETTGDYEYTVVHGDETGPVAGCPPVPFAAAPPSIVSAYADFTGTVHISSVDLPGSAAGCKVASAIVQHACCHPCNGSCTDVADQAACDALGGIFTADQSCSEVDCPDPCNVCEVCDDATGECLPDDPCNACEECDPATGDCIDTSDCNACEECNPDTGNCDDVSDCNACEECNPDTGECEESVFCDECNECDPDTGQCVAIEPPPEGCAGEGCTPGYWKLIDSDNATASHECNWEGYSPGDLFCNIFDCTGGSAFNGKTLIQVLEQGGGGPKALGRHTVAALLNAASDGVFYLFSVDDVINMFNDVWPCNGNGCNELKNTFAEQNEGVDQHCCPLGVCKCGDNGEFCDAEGSQCDDADTCGGRNQGGSNCCEAHDGIGCDDNECQELICNLDPFCCDVAWDFICADEALDLCCNYLCEDVAPPVCEPTGLPNDLCQDSQPICDGCTPFSTIDNNTDGLAHAACQFDGQTYHDEWYSYTATCTGDLTASTCDDADYDTDLVVYDGCFPDIPCPPGDPELLGCNDDAGGCGGFTSVVTVGVTEGNCYSIRVGGWMDGDMGTGNLCIACARPAGISSSSTIKPSSKPSQRARAMPW